MVAFAEGDPKRCKEAYDLYRVPRTYRDYHELLEQPDIDAVTVALPNYLHRPVTIEALEARKHVMVEKPMAVTAKEALKMIDVSKRMKRTLMVGHNFRFNRSTQIAKDVIERGELGDVYYVRASWLRRAGIPRIGSWFTRKAHSGGGCMLDLGVHMIDVSLHLLGDWEVRSVSAQVYSKLGPQGIGEFDWGKGEIDPARTFDVEDFGSALIRLRSGRTLLVESSWAAYHEMNKREYGVELFGSAGGLSLFPARLVRQTSSGYQMVELTAAKLAYPEDRLHHFVQCVLLGKKPVVALEQSLVVQQVLDAIYASARAGKEVALG